jgi:CRISPR-associated endonuclease/helicase Cas3
LSPLKEVYDESVVSIKESEYLTEGWEHSWIITTFVQFFESLFSNRNSALRKFHNMANAIIILDEIQNIPPKYFEAIEISCRKMADYFGTKFVFVTATQPLLFADSSAVKELTTPKTKHFFEKRDRIVINQHLLRQAEKITLEALTAHAEGEVGTKPGKSFLLIANTIAQSQKLYNLLELVGLPIFYLSGSILPVFRKQLIEHIKALDGSKILVSTQVVEAGVDIDFDVVYRDFAPLDSINQSAGRCNRNGIKGKGFVYLYDSGNARIYDSVLLSITKRVLACFEDEIPEAKFWELNQQYFLDVRKAVAEASDESAALLKAMQRLQLDDIERDFILISELPIYYNVFVPFEENDLKNLSYPVEITTDEMPLAVWAQYEACTAIENPFERKELLRQVMPKVLSYVAKFPKKHYSPARQDQVDKAFIFETSWRDYYDLEKGFQVPSNTSSVLMI